MKDTIRDYFCENCGDVEVERPDGDWRTKPVCINCDTVMDLVPDLGYDPLDFKFPAEDKTSREDKLERKKDLRCSFCPPHSGENASRRPKHGTKKPRGKK